MKVRTGKLSSGAEVRLRPISPHTMRGMGKAVAEKIPPEPKAPTHLVKSVDGHSEEFKLDEDSQEYRVWRDEWTAWNRDKKKIEREAAEENLALGMDYSIVAWRFLPPFPLSLIWQIFGLGWKSQPSDDWEPHLLVSQSMSRTARRVAYVMSELVVSEDDYELVSSVMMGRSSLTEQEVQRQLDGFRAARGDQAGRPAASGSDLGAEGGVGG